MDLPSNVPSDRVVDFDMYDPPGIDRGYHEGWLALRDSSAHELLWTARNEGHWIATRGALISRIFKEYENFSSRIIVLPKSAGEQHNMLPTTLDPPDHRHFRNLLNAGLSPRAVAGMRDDIRTVAIELIEALQPRGGCDFIADYAHAFPIRIFLKLVDLPVGDAAHLKFLTDQVTRLEGKLPFEEAVAAFHEYLHGVIEARLGGTSEDLISRIINGKVDGRDLTRYEMLQLSAQILIAGLDTVVNFLGFAMLHLADHPEERAQMTSREDLIPKAAGEFFRRFPIVSVAREVRRAIDVDGVTLKTGDMVLLPSALHGLDERENACPLQVDYERDERSHSTFGNGSHRCPGSFLARAELEITIEEWLKRIPEFRTAPGFKPSFGGGIVGRIQELPLTWAA